MINSILRLTLILCAISAFSQETTTTVPKRSYTTASIEENQKITIDGLIDETAWDVVEWTGDYIENRPDNNTEPTEQTKFKIVYDEKNLYIAFKCYDASPEGIVKRLSRRDGFDGDWVEINIDSYNDKRTAFSFTITAAGVKGDEFISNNNNFDSSWNPIWYVKTNVDAEGWTAEMRIPLSQLRFSNEADQVWGLQSTRRYFRAEERSLWQHVPLDAPGWVSEFGELRGLKNLKPQKQLEIQPYTVAKLETYPEEEGNPFRDGSDTNLTAGLDAKIGVTNDLTLDVTINPDFGQVEADPAAIALDGFQIFFREQRPFFVENKNIFDYQFADNQDNVFYSRRIGRSPQGSGFSNGAAYVDQPANSTILGAAKFSGKTKNGWSIGILESVTAKEFAKTDDGSGGRDEVLVEPLTNYLVSRVQKDFNNNNSYVGGIFTATNRKLEENLNYLRKEAYTGGLDFRHNWKNRKYYAEGNLVLSHVMGSKEAITATQTSLTHLFNRVDADHVSVDPNRTSLTGTGGKIEAGKASSGHWRYNGGFVWRSPELELNDIGFLRQADDMKQYFNLNYQTLKPFGNFRRIGANFNQFTTYDFEGNYNRIQYRVSGNAQFQNNWWTDIGFIHKPRIFTNTILRGGPRYRFSDENINFWFFGTDERKKLRTSAGYVYSFAKQNNFSFLEISGDVTYQPTNAIRVSIGPRYTKNPSKTQYVTETDFNGTPRYILASIDQQSLSASVRVNYTINPNLTLQFYGEPFIARGRYNKFKYVNNPVADDLYDRFNQYDNNQISLNNGVYEVDEDTDGIVDYTIGNPDFSFVQFRSNLVLRWEYIPGSEIFLVWSQGTTGFANPGESLISGLNDQIIKQQPENIFLIKATYRFLL